MANGKKKSVDKDRGSDASAHKDLSAEEEALMAEVESAKSGAAKAEEQHRKAVAAREGARNSAKIAQHMATEAVSELARKQANLAKLQIEKTQLEAQKQKSDEKSAAAAAKVKAADGDITKLKKKVDGVEAKQAKVETALSDLGKEKARLHTEQETAQMELNVATATGEEEDAIKADKGVVKAREALDSLAVDEQKLNEERKKVATEKVAVSTELGEATTLSKGQQNVTDERDKLAAGWAIKARRIAEQVTGDESTLGDAKADAEKAQKFAAEAAEKLSKAELGAAAEAAAKNVAEQRNAKALEALAAINATEYKPASRREITDNFNASAVRRSKDVREANATMKGLNQRRLVPGTKPPSL